MTGREHVRNLALVGLLGLALAALPHGMSVYLRSFAMFSMMYVVLALSWNIISGFTGYTSFGHVAFYGIGAYATAILVADHGWPWVPTLVVAAGFAALVALTVGYPVLRLKGPYFAIAMLGMAEGTRVIATVWDGLTHGGLGISFPSTENSLPTYHAMLVVMLLTVVVAYVVGHSRFGIRLNAIREDEGAAEALGIPEGALALYVAGPDHVSSPALDRVRQMLAARLHLVPEGRHDFLWVVDFPLFEKDPASGRLSSVHHPFTAPHPDDHALLHSSPERVRALAYDVVMDGMELGGGSIRISDPGLQSTIFSLLGIDERTAQARFGFLLEGLRSGAPPHGGIAFGFDRISMVLAGATSLRDVIAFPKTTAARALFEGAPGAVPDEELQELHISATTEGMEMKS